MIAIVELEAQYREATKQLHRTLKRKRSYEKVGRKLHDYKAVDRRDWL